MKLSKRLETVASFVPKGSNIAEIGTDHGYVPIYLVREGLAEHAVAMDVRKGPLERAKAHVAEAGLENRIDVRLSDGLTGLKPGEADCVVIETMRKEDGKYYPVRGGPRGGLSGENDSEPHYLYGSRLIRQKNPVLAEFLKKEQEQLEQILDTLKDSDTPAALKRRVEMMEKLAWNKEAQDEMLGTDTEA